MVEEEIRIHNPFRSEAKILKIGTQEHEIMNAYDGNSMSQWLAEGETVPTTDTAQFTTVTIKPHKIIAQWEITEEIEADAIIDLPSFMAGYLGREMGQREANGFINGTGDTNNQPTGLLRATTTTDKEGTTLDENPFTFHAIKTGANGDFIADTTTEKGMAARKLMEIVTSLKNGYTAGAKWYCNRPTLARLMRITDPDGSYILIPDFRSGFNMNILGHPVVTMDYFPNYNVTNALGMVFGNMMRAYCIVDRSGYTHLRDPYTKKSRIVHYVRKRVGGKPIEGASMRFIQFAA